MVHQTLSSADIVIIDIQRVDGNGHRQYETALGAYKKGTTAYRLVEEGILIDLQNFRETRGHVADVNFNKGELRDGILADILGEAGGGGKGEGRGEGKERVVDGRGKRDKGGGRKDKGGSKRNKGGGRRQEV